MTLRRIRTLVLAALVLLGGLPTAFAQIPSGYYDTVDASNTSALRSSLHEVIDDHTRVPYTSSATDTWDVLEQADENPVDPSNILDVYKNASYPKQGGGNSFYNREHTWPKSYGFPNDGSTNYPYTDCHHLFLCDSGYNSSRSNKPFRSCDGGCSEKATDVNFGQGGGTGLYPGNSNWTSGSFSAGTWEVWGQRRGDVARALLYLDVRYEGGTHGVTGVSEPDLILTDSEALIAASNTGSNESVAYMGMLSVLLQWHASDPVDDLERWRNDRVYDTQGNRNPFIDHPEWVDCLFNGTCGGGGDVTPPSAPAGLTATGGAGTVDLDWSDNVEPDLAGYDVHRSETGGGPYAKLNGGPIVGSAYSDATVASGTTYFYVVTAVDTSSNASGFSGEASATPTGGGAPADPWINEFHYDNASSDVGEFVEVAGPAGLDLGGWQIVGYNGNGGGTYATVNLSGVLADQGGCTGAASFSFSGMQNGAPDGLALVDPGGVVIEFLSYEGTFSATNGPASGLASVDVGVAESSSTPAGWSLQRGGSGSAAADFSWQAAQVDTPGLPNAGQTFAGGCGGGGPTAPSAPTGLAANAGDGLVDLAWDANTEPDVTGYNVWRSTTSGGGYAQLNGASLPTPAYSDGAVSNGTTYYYVVTAVNSAALESAPSSEAAATPVDTTPPAAPGGLGAVAGDAVVDLDWSDNGEADLAGYRVYRATSSGGPYSQLTSSTVAASAFSDVTPTNDTTYFYVVTAEDGDGNESGFSAEVSATPSAPAGGGTPWINEFHYDNSGSDKKQGVEVAGPAGFDLTGWQIVAYNGSNQSSYRTKTFNGSLSNQQGGFGTKHIGMGLQNGAPDGIALVDPQGVVVQFLSYEGTFTGGNGPAAGMTSTDVGVSETSSTALGYSLQLAGAGSSYADFTWQSPQAHTRNGPNAGQTFLSP